METSRYGQKSTTQEPRLVGFTRFGLQASVPCGRRLPRPPGTAKHHGLGLGPFRVLGLRGLGLRVRGFRGFGVLGLGFCV